MAYAYRLNAWDLPTVSRTSFPPQVRFVGRPGNAPYKLCPPLYSPESATNTNERG